jgi:transposase
VFGFGPATRIYVAAGATDMRKHFKLNKQDAASIPAVELINELFAVGARARNQNMDHAARHALRHEKAPPLLAQIRIHIQEMSKTLLPKSAAGAGCTYTLGIWEKLIRFLALGRGNWIHIGSEQAGPRLAAIVPVIESCRRLKIPVRNYLADILPGLANAPLHSFVDRTPAAGAAKHAQMIRNAFV